MNGKSSWLVVSILIAALPSPIFADNFKWSYKNTNPVAGGKVASISEIDGTYTDPKTGVTTTWVSDTFKPPLLVGPQQHVSSNVHIDIKTLLSPNDYNVIVQDPGFTTNFELAFVVGSPGSFQMLDLGQAAQSLGYVGDNEFQAPAMFSNSQDLYAAVDLTQWLNAPTVITPGEQITITNGTSTQLPGYLFSSSPITFSLSAGFVSDSTLNGTVYAGGILDGSAIPEPSSLTLSVLGIFCLLGYGSWRWGKNTR